MIEIPNMYLKRTKPTQKNLRKVHQMQHVMLYQHTICNYLLSIETNPTWFMNCTQKQENSNFTQKTLQN